MMARGRKKKANELRERLWNVWAFYWSGGKVGGADGGEKAVKLDE
jgi:hypothetical protein